MAGVGLGITIFIIGAYVLVPGASLIINRIVNSEGDVLSGREVFWNYAMECFGKPIVGKGFYRLMIMPLSRISILWRTLEFIRHTMYTFSFGRNWNRWFSINDITYYLDAV